MNFRTDLALERHESAGEGEIEGVSLETRNEDGMKISIITVLNQAGEKKLDKPKGKYLTAEMPSLSKDTTEIENYSRILSGEIKKLLPESGTVLVVGLGNSSITPDALGPECISSLLATRHISKELACSVGFPTLRSVAALVPGVLGTTGIEAAEIIKGVADEISPSAVVVIDALAARSLNRLGTTVQMCDTGVSPGSGVGNSRKKIDSEFLGIPVIAIGVPTVVDGITVALDIMEESGIMLTPDKKTDILKSEKGMMVTPKEIDLVIKRAAKLVSLSLNCALQPDLTAEEISSLVAVV